MFCRILNRLTFLFVLIFLPCISAAKNAPQSDFDATMFDNAGNHGLFFTENKGQWNELALFKADASRGMTWWMERDGLTLDVSVPDTTAEPIVDDNPFSGRSEFQHPRYPIKGHVLKFRFVAPIPESVEYVSAGHNTSPSNPTAQAKAITPSDALPWNNNYFLGNDSSKWAPDCHNYTKLTYSNVWDGVDVVYYGDGKRLKYDIVVQPGADPSRVKMRWQGLDSPLTLSDDGALELATSVGTLREALPEAYQLTEAGYKTPVQVHLAVRSETEFGFDIDEYDPALPLVIDPLIWSTYLGGSGGDQIHATCADGQGGVYMTGFSASANFPVTEGAYQSDFSGGDWPRIDAIITRLSADGSQLLFSTFLGGENDEEAWDIMVNEDGGVIVTGEISRGGFPITEGAFQEEFGGSIYDAFVSRLNADGNQLIYSTYLGGSRDESACALCSDGEGGVIVTGDTYSTNYPVTNGVIQRIHAGRGSKDAFVTRLNPQGTELLFSTFLGGTSMDLPKTIVADNDGGVVFGGSTGSDEFPISEGAYQDVYHENGDVFITGINSNGDQLIFSTFLGGEDGEKVRKIATDAEGNIYAIGETCSREFPTTDEAYQDNFGGGEGDIFVTKLNPDASQLDFSTYIGGQVADYGYGIALDAQENIAIGGNTADQNFPVSAGAFQENYAGGNTDAILLLLDSRGSQLLYCTYLGGDQQEAIMSVLPDGLGGFFTCGHSYSEDFPITEGSFDLEYNGICDIFLSSFQLFFEWDEFPTIVEVMERDEISLFLEGRALIDNPDLTISYHSDNLPDAIEFNDLGDGLAELIWQTDIGDAGEYTAEFTLSDGFHELTSVSQIIVTPFPLSWSELPDTIEATANDTVCFTVEAISLIENDTLTVSAIGGSLPEGAEITTIDNGAWEFFWLPTSEDAGSYRLRLLLSNGDLTLPGYIDLVIHDAGSVGNDDAIPTQYTLHPAHPNPFNSTTTIGYSLPVAGTVSLAVYDLSGREVARLVDVVQPAGMHEAVWVADGMSSGAYVVRMKTGTGFVATQKVIFTP